MITKEITICGKQVTLGYCFAASIEYRNKTNEEMVDYANHVIESYIKEYDPDEEKTIQAILACMKAYYDANDKEIPLTEKELINGLDSVEMVVAAYTIVSMRQEFYHVPKGEPEDKPKDGEDAEKNA